MNTSKPLANPRTASLSLVRPAFGLALALMLSGCSSMNDYPSKVSAPGYQQLLQVAEANPDPNAIIGTWVSRQADSKSMSVWRVEPNGRMLSNVVIENVREGYPRPEDVSTGSWHYLENGTWLIRVDDISDSINYHNHSPASTIGTVRVAGKNQLLLSTTGVWPGGQTYTLEAVFNREEE